MSYINIIKENIPYQFDIRLNKLTYTMEINYNPDFDFFTVSVADSTGTVLTSGEKLILNKEILSTQSYVSFPTVKPLDAAGVETEITWGNFGETVFLTVGGVGE